VVLGEHPPAVPNLAARSLVFWLGYRSSKLLDHVDRRAVGCTAMRLTHAESNVSALARVRKEHIGVVFDGEAWRNQLERGHPMRGDAFERLGYRMSGRRFDPDAQTVGGSEQDWLAEAFITAQERLRPSSLLSPGHFSMDPTGRSRDLDLQLLERCIEITRAMPARVDGSRGELFANIVIAASTLTTPAVSWLIDAYARLPVAGYWIWVSHFNESAKRFELVRQLALGLQAETGRATVTGGLGHTWQAGLRNGMAAVCTGPQRSHLNLLPPAVEPDAEDEEGRRSHVYLGRVMGAFSLDLDGQQRERAAFQRYGCPCGQHARRTAPGGERQRRAHNVRWLMREALAATRGDARDASRSLDRRIAEATAARAWLGMGPLPTAWRHAQAVPAHPGQAEGLA
jgi:hypothetical protein